MSSVSQSLHLPTYRQWQAFHERLPLPHMLECIACRERLDWQAYDVARRGKRGGVTREQATVVRVGALCKVKQYEWYIPANGSSEDIIESWKDAVIPFHASGIGCPACQVAQASADADAIRQFDSMANERKPQRTVLSIPFQFNPATNLRLPTAVSTRNTYIRTYARHAPAKRIAYIDVTDKVMEC
jgi:hypothetical protein